MLFYYILNLVDERDLSHMVKVVFAVLCIEIVWFSTFCAIPFVGRSVNLGCQAIMSRSLDHMFDDSSDALPPCDKVKNVMVNLLNVDGVSNAGACMCI